MVKPDDFLITGLVFSWLSYNTVVIGIGFCYTPHKIYRLRLKSGRRHVFHGAYPFAGDFVRRKIEA